MARLKLPTPEEIQAAVEDFGTQTDRGLAIVAVSLLEQMLEIVLTQRMMPLSKKRYAAIFGTMAPLSSFSAKIEMALALGVISENFYYQLHALREVRNRFAHRIEALTFDHPEIQKAMHVAHSRLPVRMSDPKSDFLLRFSVAGLMLIFSARHDIRIKPLSETHASEFDGIISAAKELLSKAASRKPSST
jgi:DNA-binding MltR family transcriptional regulator